MLARHVILGIVGFRQSRIVFRVAGDADDCPERILRDAEANPFSNWVLIWKQASRQRFADDNGLLIWPAVLLLKPSASHDRNSEHAKVVRSHATPRDQTSCSLVKWRLPFNLNAREKSGACSQPACDVG